MLAADGRWGYAASRPRVVMCGSLDFAQTGVALVTWGILLTLSSSGFLPTPFARKGYASLAHTRLT